jgi:hypothetical protein
LKNEHPKLILFKICIFLCKNNKRLKIISEFLRTINVNYNRF